MQKQHEEMLKNLKNENLKKNLKIKKMLKIEL